VKDFLRVRLQSDSSKSSPLNALALEFQFSALFSPRFVASLAALGEIFLKVKNTTGYYNRVLVPWAGQAARFGD